MNSPKLLPKFLQFVAVAIFFTAAYSQSTDFVEFAKILKTGTIEQKRNALYELRNLSSEQASRIASIAITDSNEIIRATATHSILYLPSDESLSLLLPLLLEKFPFVRKEAAYALGKTKNKRASESLIKILQKDKDLEVRGAAAFALGLIGDPKAIDLLAGSLKSKNIFVQRSAARSLGQIGELKSLASLEAKLLDKKIDEDVRRETAWAIDEIKKKQILNK
jgi:HEAT repeat protein